MKKYLIAFVLLFGALPAYASDDFFAKDKTNAFGYPDNELVKIIEAPQGRKNIHANIKPACNDERITSKIKEILSSYINDDALKIADKRRNKLVIKNIDGFEEIKIEEDKSKMPRIVAARLVELKINEHLNDENIKVCKSSNPALETDVYLFIFDNGDKVVVDAVNLISSSTPRFVWTND